MELFRDWIATNIVNLSFSDCISIITLVVGVVGGVVALKQWKDSILEKRSIILKDLIEKVRGDEQIPIFVNGGSAVTHCFWATGIEVLRMQEETKNALVYCAAFSTLKRLLLEGQISRQLFDRLNRMNAEKMNCKPINL